MSVTTEVAPTVFIPERARTAATGSSTARSRLALVSDGLCYPSAPATIPKRTRSPIGVRPGSVTQLQSRRRSAETPQPAGMVVPGAALRLTRRGMLALVLATLAVGALVLLVAHLSAPAVSAAHPQVAAGGVITVEPGDTLWSIAGQLAPDRDPRAVVDQLQRANSLHRVSLTPGQTLNVG